MNKQVQGQGQLGTGAIIRSDAALNTGKSDETTGRKRCKTWEDIEKDLAQKPRRGRPRKRAVSVDLNGNGSNIAIYTMSADIVTTIVNFACRASLKVLQLLKKN